jgi:hypothetical protein
MAGGQHLKNDGALREYVSLREIWLELSAVSPTLCVPIAEKLGCRTGNIRAGCEMLVARGVAERVTHRDGTLCYRAIHGPRCDDAQIPAWRTMGTKSGAVA